MSSDSATPATVLKTHGLIGVQDEFSNEPCPKCNIPIKYCVSCVSFEEFDRLNKEDWYLIQTHEIVGVSNRHSEEPCHKCNIPIKYCLACVTMEEYDRMLTENHSLSSVWINRSESKNTSLGENFAQGDSFGENTSESITHGASENKKDECGYTKTDNGYFIICPVTGEKHIVTFE
jgi:hypothetical protein